MYLGVYKFSSSPMVGRIKEGFVMASKVSDEIRLAQLRRAVQSLEQKLGRQVEAAENTRVQIDMFRKEIAACESKG